MAPNDLVQSARPGFPLALITTIIGPALWRQVEARQIICSKDAT